MKAYRVRHTDFPTINQIGCAKTGKALKSQMIRSLIDAYTDYSFIEAARGFSIIRSPEYDKWAKQQTEILCVDEERVREAIAS